MAPSGERIPGRSSKAAEWSAEGVRQEILTGSEESQSTSGAAGMEPASVVNENGVETAGNGSGSVAPETWSQNEVPTQGSPVRVSTDRFQMNVVIVNEMGLHARPASLFVELANKFTCEVTIFKGSEPVDGKSILQLLSLSAEAGTPLVLETRGPDAKVAVQALSDLVASGFNEMGPPA